MIKQAIIPLAGLGTRLLPLTSVMPKELLPINGKPNLEYILDECIEAGIKEFVFIISKNKLSIKKYFFNDNFYKKIIKKKKDKRLLEKYKKIKRYQKMIKFVYQNKPKGTGDAVLKCQKFIKNKYFLMLLPDDLIIRNNCSKEMIRLHNKTYGSVIATKRVERKTVSRWGILSIKIAGINGIALTKLDVLDELKEIKICIGYNLNGKKLDYLPSASEDQFNVKPIYKTFPGWQNPTQGIRNISDLPEKAKNYIYALEDFIGAKISSISTSPEREDTILIEDPFKT